MTVNFSFKEFAVHRVGLSVTNLDVLVEWEKSPFVGLLSIHS
jgi:hypothetical protein